MRIFNNTLIITFICIALFSSCLSNKYTINVIEDLRRKGITLLAIIILVMTVSVIMVEFFAIDL